MSLLLALNDHGLAIGDDSGILARSRGSVVESHGEVLFGDEASARSRLHPVTFNNRFWHELDMDPLSRAVANFRHHADMAYAHLMHLAEQAELSAREPVDVMVLLPGTYGRQQLGTLLGIMQHTPFRPVALVDIGVVAGAAALERKHGLHIDMHLHQMVVTGLQRDDEAVRQDRATAVPGLGWHQVEEALAAMITDAFIRQARFNPQHDAHWEQQLYDRLPEWLGQARTDEDNLVMVLEASGTRHQARLTRTALEQRLHTLYRRLFESAQLSAERALVLAERCAGLPGLRSALLQEAAADGASGTVGDEQLLETALPLVEHLRQEPGQALLFVRAVSLQRSGHGTGRRQSPAAAGETVPATHILYGHEARPLVDGLCCCAGDGEPVVMPSDRQGDDAARNDRQVLGEIRAVDGHFNIRCRATGLMRNDRPCAVGREEPLYSGDRLRISDDPRQVLQLIRVHDG